MKTRAATDSKRQSVEGWMGNAKCGFIIEMSTRRFINLFLSASAHAHRLHSAFCKAARVDSCREILIAKLCVFCSSSCGTKWASLPLSVSSFPCTFQGGKGGVTRDPFQSVRPSVRPSVRRPSLFCIPMLKEERIRSLCKIDDRDSTQLQRKKEHGRAAAEPFSFSHTVKLPPKVTAPFSSSLCSDLPICTNCRWDDRRKEERKKSLAKVERIFLAW